MEAPQNLFDFIKPRSIQTPEDSYFSDLALQIATQEEKRRIPLYKKSYFVLSSLAASIIATIFIASLFSDDSTSGYQFPEPDKREILAYINENIEDFDLDLIVEAMPDTLLTVSPQERILNDDVASETIILPEIEKHEIEEYLKQYNVDPEDPDENGFI